MSLSHVSVTAINSIEYIDSKKDSSSILGNKERAFMRRKLGNLDMLFRFMAWSCIEVLINFNCL